MEKNEKYILFIHKDQKEYYFSVKKFQENVFFLLF